MGTVANIEAILKQHGRKLNGKYKRYLGTLPKPELEQIYLNFKAEVVAWQKKQAEEARALEAEQAAPSPEAQITAQAMAAYAKPVESQPVRKIQLRKAEG